MKFLVILCALLGLAWSSAAADSGENVLVIFNTEMKGSKDVADHYARARSVPKENLIGLQLPFTETITREDFQSMLVRPLLKETEKRKLLNFKLQPVQTTNGKPAGLKWTLRDSKIRYLVLCYGVPSRIVKLITLKEDNMEKLPVELRRNEASVDSDLALLPLHDHKLPLTGPIDNKLYATTNAASFHSTNGILMITRLDGPSVEIIKGTIDKALEAEKNGLWGRTYFDLRGVTNSYKVGDDWLRGAGNAARAYGFDTIADMGPDLFPATFPMSQIAFYSGWYKDRIAGPLAAEKVEFMPGAFAYHLHSFNAHSIRTPSNYWVGPLLAKGATITMGSVDEPYLSGTPDIHIFYRNFILFGFSFGEAYTSAQTALSWQNVGIGDPLYRPFAKSSKQRHEELAKSKNPLLEWSHNSVVNLNLTKGYPVADVLKYLEEEPLTKTSAVLQEKLAEVYLRQTNSAKAVEAFQAALKLKPTPQQELRLVLEMVDILVAQKKEAEAYPIVEKYVSANRDYPGNSFLYKWLAETAEKLGKKDEAARYEKLHKDFKPAA